MSAAPSESAGAGAGAVRTPGAVASPEDAVARFREEGCSGPRFWGNGPGDRYGRHSHDYHKVLFCLEGSITFHTADGDVELEPGDRLDLEPGVEHAATVGTRGVSCVEATR
jgi:mannose-6-phosphate isomerase-like protein (cupin superfamily)